MKLNHSILAIRIMPDVHAGAGCFRTGIMNFEYVDDKVIIFG